MRSLRGHKRVLIDTAVWTYHFEQHPQFAAPAGRIIESLEAGTFIGIASELTLLELTVRPLQLGRQDVADEYELLLEHFPHLELRPISREILLAAASLRARLRLRTPDAIQVATGMIAGATAAVTNDDAWRALPDLDTVILSDLIE